MREMREKGVFGRIFEALGFARTVGLIFALIGVAVLFLWVASDNIKLAEKLVDATHVAKGMWKLEFNKESNPAAFEKSIKEFSENTGTRIKMLYTLPKEMRPDPEKPVVYIFTEAFEDHKGAASEIPPANIEPPRPYTSKNEMPEIPPADLELPRPYTKYEGDLL
jgi:hypothetical protein